MRRRWIRLTLVAMLMGSIALASCGGDSADRSDANQSTSIVDVEPDPAPTQTTRATQPAETPAVSDTPTPDNVDPSPTPTDVQITPEPPAASPTPLGPTPTVPPIATMPPPPPPATVMGEGTTASTPVVFPRGLAVITMNHTGLERFRVRMQSRDGSFDRLMGEGTGTWKGSRGVMVRAEQEYVFSVVADGPWQIDILWPTPETAPVSEVPFHYSGTGDQAVYFVLVQTGVHSLTMTHDADGGFSIQTLTSEGRRYLGNLRGKGHTTETREIEVDEKAFEFILLNVGAEGNWTISVE